MKIRILPACDTFDSKERPLLAGEIYSVPEDISAEDAQTCIEQGKAEETADDTPSEEEDTTDAGDDANQE